ncbi:hypothetical protein [Rhizobacter sp. Root1221]|uniref:hypothetical protein n=1 Tax=Rhizobacter sp. Root1221 TaxID=1736433 RepID=UPI0012FAEA27|nr:hypothetical protein [Rhizobacter sp. Root1221]
MAHLARVAAGTTTSGLDSKEGNAFSIIVAIVLSRLASKCDNPSAVRGAADALQAGTPYFFKPVQNPYTGKYEGGLSVDTTLFSGVNPGGDLDDPLATSLESMVEGGHVFFSVGQKNRGDGHALGVSVTNLGNDEAQVSIFNSNGWSACLASRHNPLVISGSTSMWGAHRMLAGLATDTIEPSTDSRMPRRDWDDAAAGASVFHWMKSYGMEPSIRDIRATRPMTPQKSGDCMLEVRFAWLASVLPQADYKLVKANTLNILSDHAVGVASRSLKERVTSSLSGHAMAEYE